VLVNESHLLHLEQQFLYKLPCSFALVVMVGIPLLVDYLPVSWNTVSTQIVSIKVAKLEPSPRMGMLRLHDEYVKHLFIIFGVK
jgi:hypothetical protein